MQARSPWIIVALAVASLSIPAGAQEQDRPMKGSLVGYDEYGACEGGTTITSIATGEITHLGRRGIVSSVCLGPDYLPIGPWPFTFTAANGDQVHGVVTGWVFTDYGFDLIATITHGTGRFADASGELTFPTVSTGSGTWSSDIEGWISY